MASEQRTEQPTQRRLEKARREGQFPAARHFVSGLQFVALIAVLGRFAHSWLAGGAESIRWLLKRAFGPEFGPAEVVRIARDLAWAGAAPIFIWGGVLMASTLASQLFVTNVGFSTAKLWPDVSRLNPLARLRELPAQNVPAALQGIVVLLVAGGAIYITARDNLAVYLAAPAQGLPAAAGWLGMSIQDLLWRAAYIFVALGCIDLFRQRRRHQNALRMTKQELREEMKESEGNPQIKARIRRIQRDQARKRMMQAIPSATAVVVNPTHFAVAIQYSPESMAAPRVVAKGKNYLAQRIKQRAIEHLVPIVENAPLAQALYKSVDVGQEIPPELYRAVAEILAYIFKILHRHMPGERRRL